MERNVGIVGASIAGFWAARHLAQHRIPVTVYEAQETFEPDARTLIVTPAWLRLQDGSAEFPILNRIDAFELISQSQSVRIPLQEPDVVVERACFLRVLARQAERAGAQFRLGHRLVRMEPAGSGWNLCFENGVGTATVSRVLGADGAGSTVARALGRDGREQVAILQARVALPSHLSTDTVRVWFDRDSTRFFYWLIPESPETGIAGLIAESDGAARQSLGQFLAAQNLAPMGYQAAVVPLHRWGERGAPSAGDGVLLAGDAAGQVKVTTVGGVVTGMRGGVAAARAWVHGCGATRQLRYLRRELDAHALVRYVLDRFRNEDYDALLACLNRRASHVLRTYPRDELTRALWRLLITQPRWLSLGARALIRSVLRSEAP
jgi:flavin-dependent dehydrogenase